MKKITVLLISILLCLPSNLLALESAQENDQYDINIIDETITDDDTDLNSSYDTNLISEIEDSNNISIDKKIYDFAEVLTDSEEENLKNLVKQYIDQYNMDMVLVTVNNHNKASTKAYAEDFYDYNGFGVGSTHDGVIFVIDYSFGYTDIYMATTGEAIRVYDDNRIDNILDDIAYNKNNGVFAMFKAFIDSSSDYAAQGVASSNRNTYIDENGDLIVKKTIPWFLYIIISIVIPSIVVFIFIAKNKMVKKATKAAAYLDKDSIKLTKKNDKFITTFTSRVRINTDSGSHSGGGSSTSRGSSGISHGGGGRRL